MSQKRKRSHSSRNNKRLARIESLEARQMLAADVPFDGSAILYQVHGHTTQGQLSTIDIANGGFQDVGSAAGFKINASGYRTADHFIYAIKTTTDELVKLDANGSTEVLGPIAGLPNQNYYSGDFGGDGLLYLWSRTALYGVNVETQTVDQIVTLSRSMGSTPDIAFNPTTDLFYGVERTSSSTRSFVSVDPASGQVTTINPAFQPGNGTFGAMFADATGRVFAANNQGGLYEVDVESGEPTFAGFSPRASTNDGSSPATAIMNLPPVAHADSTSIAVATTDNPLHATTPTDPEGDLLKINITGLPNHGAIKYDDGSLVAIGDSVTAAQLSSLLYDAPANAVDDAGTLTYNVNDGQSSASGSVQITLGGLSSLQGTVMVEHDNDDSTYSAYAFNNQIQLSGVLHDGTTVTATTQTDVHGQYRFDQLAPGDYAIAQVQPDVVKEGIATAGLLGGSVAENLISGITIPAGQARAHGGNDFIELAPASISGFVYVDEDFDGQLDGAESGVRFVGVTLSGIDDLGQSVSETVETDQFGFYEINGLRPGEYSLSQSQPTGYINSVVNVGSEGGQIGEDAVSQIQLGPGVEATHYDFGEFAPNLISGSVFIDNDWDGVFDPGDTPIRDATIQLSGQDLRGNEVSVTAITDDNGRYQFDRLAPGTYTVTQVEQPTGLVDGRDNLGSFDGQPSQIQRNGVAGNDQFAQIQLRQGESARGYDFGERLVYELASQFDTTTRFVGTAGNDVFSFVAGEEFHEVSVNGVVTQLDASLQHDISFVGYSGDDTITIIGTSDVESVRLRPTMADYHARTFRVRSYHTETAVVHNGGGFDRVFLYDSAGDDHLRATEGYALITGEGFRNQAFGFHRTYAYATRGGFDRVTMTDSKRDDTFIATSSNSRMFGQHYYNFNRGFDRVVAKAVYGGNDTARLWDSAKDKDIFQSTPNYARMYNTDFYNYASGFDTVTAYANQGGENDRAYFLDTEGNDILVSTPTKTGISNEFYTHSAKDFERMYAYSTEGDDRAYLYDSKLDDVFRATPTDARLYNADYYLKVNNFSQVDAYSSGGGNDRAYFFDSAGDDTLISLENEVRMFGAGFDNTSHGFQRAYAFAGSGGDDRAIMYDSDQADTVRISDGLTRMYGQGYYTRLQNFGTIDTVFSDIGNQDRALIFGGISQGTLDQAGSLASHISANSAAYIYGADAIAAMQGEDVENDAYTLPGLEGESFDLTLKDF